MKLSRDEISRFAWDAGIQCGFTTHIPHWDKLTWKFMRSFANRIEKKMMEDFSKVADAMTQNALQAQIQAVAQERERCAKICEEPGWIAAKWCADQIRGRK